jgi:hypothetical protein
MGSSGTYTAKCDTRGASTNNAIWDFFGVFTAHAIGQLILDKI